MKTKNVLILSVIVFIFLIAGCAQQQTKYVCPDGSTISDSSLCPKQDSTKSVVCQDGTKVNDYSQCCSKNAIASSTSGLQYCRDATGTYSERIYCDGDFSVKDSYSCQSNRCIKSTDRRKCVAGATCEPYENTDTVTCVLK